MEMDKNIEYQIEKLVEEIIDVHCVGLPAILGCCLYNNIKNNVESEIKKIENTFK